MAHKYRKKWLNIALFPVMVLLSTTHADFTTECQRPCDCRWQSGNKAAICSNSSLRAVPANLSNDIQILDLSNNNIHQLYPEAFKKVGLSNLKKLFLRECFIESVSKTAFLTLAIMIELDLSKNRIQYLHPDTFKGTEKLRLINLSNNLIDKLDDGLFRNMKYLQKVEMSNNKIIRIGTKTFVNLPQFKILRLDGNLLSHMKPETLMSLNNLSGLDLHNNPWRCDCNLQVFRNWVISHNLYTPPTSCAEPPILREKLWNELESSNFACRPTILEPHPDATVKSSEENVTLTCKVVGNPTPEVVWRFNAKTIEPRSFGEIRYVVSENTVDLIRWVNLTILNARYSDKGNYSCVAENPGGQDEKSLNLILTKYSSGIAGLDADVLAVLIGTFLTIVVIISGVFMVCYLTSHKNKSNKIMKNVGRRSNGDVLIDGSVGSELEKGFISEVNPLTKPPRKHEIAPSVTSAATEMSELNKNLLDNDSCSANTEDIHHLKENEQLSKISPEALILDRLSQDQTYPPDLLSFPLRGSPQTSPASVNIKESQEILQNCDSPLKSPMFNNMTYRYPVPSTSTAQLVKNKGGYVTLPRRPRIPGWLPDNSNTNGLSSVHGTSPFYDNFGMKLFNSGSNYYSLNKSELDVGNCKDLHLYNAETLDDIEPAPSPAPGTPHANIPRNSLSSPNIHNQLMALQAIAASHKLTSVDTRPLKIRVTPPDSDRDLRSSNKEILLLSNNVNGRSSVGWTKTAPKPPPKPRKKSSNEFKEPFLLSSGDTATQV